MTEPTEAEIEVATQAIRTEAEKSGGDLYGRCARAALTAAAEVRGRVPVVKPTIAELEAILRENNEAVVVNPDGSVTRLMSIYGATEDQDEDVLGIQKGE